MPAVEFTESIVELAALEWFAQIGYSIGHGPDLEPGGLVQARATYQDVLLRPRLLAALRKLNPGLPQDAIDEAVRRLANVGQPSLILTNRDAHLMIANGIVVDINTPHGIRGEIVNLIDYDTPGNNEFLAVNQVTVKGTHTRRPDIVIYINGIPLAVIELKNMADSNATADHAYNQLQTYKEQIPALFATNALLLISDGAVSGIGTITSGRERFAQWKTIDGETIAEQGTLETAIRGVFEPRILLDLIRNFIVFEDDGKHVIKKVAQYHQYHAVGKAVSTALEASGTNGDGKGGVLWHTQGSGKSLSMLFFAGKLIRHPRLTNPTIVMITDRTDLDDQLFGTFARGQQLLRQKPVKAESRAHLRELLSVNAGGVVFTTIQKFLNEDAEEQFPQLSDRRNIIVMADEAHRTQYGLGNRMNSKGEIKAGLAQNMRDALPNATYVAFTGTPLELSDKSTRLVFGDYIDIYDIGRAIADGATVPIYYEARRIDLDLPEDAADLLDKEFDDLTEDREADERDKVASKWAQLEAVVGTPKRLAQVAADVVEHIDRRYEANEGKVMIVTMSRRIAVDLYDQIAKLRPEWDDRDDQGVMKVIMTASASDPLEWQRHSRNKERREKLANRFKDPDDPFRVVIVRDMWLTGFDAPSLHTMYIDKPMKGHGLMQAIARVNRVFRDKQGGWVVDYLGITNNLKEALRVYMQQDVDQELPIGNADEEFSTDLLVGALLRELQYCREAFEGFDFLPALNGSPSERMQTIANAQNFLLQKNGFNGTVVKDFLDHATALRNAFRLASATPEAQAIKLEYAFYQLMQATIAKTTGNIHRMSDQRLDLAVRQLVDDAIAPNGVVDVFAAAGLQKPNIAVISDSFLDDLRHMPQKNLSLEMLKRLINEEISSTRRKSIVQSRKFSERLEESLNRYHNRAVEMAEIIEALIDLAKTMRDESNRGEELGLRQDEYAFYEALALNNSAVDVLGDEQLLTIAREVAQVVRQNASIDWRKREQVRAKLRATVKRVLRRYKYPPDQQESATALIIEQAEALVEEAVG